MKIIDSQLVLKTLFDKFIKTEGNWDFNDLKQFLNSVDENTKDEVLGSLVHSLCIEHLNKR